MKKISVLCVLLLMFTSFFGCKESEADKRKKSIEIMTTQTLGLAYLEEFKLVEAENEFLKLIELAPDDKLGYANLGLVYLRMGKYKDAEVQILKAKDIDPNDADISLLLSTVYQLDGRREEAIKTLQTALVSEPGQVKILYDLAELYSAESGETALELQKSYLQQLVKYAPDNIVPQLQLTEMLIAEGNSDKAIERLEILQKQFPEFPKESKEFYDKTKENLQGSDTEKALINFTIFHNYLRVSFPYQSGINELKGPGGSQIGFPLITYNRSMNDEPLDDRSILELIKFKDVSSDLGLKLVPSLKEGDKSFENTTHIKAADFNGDGKTDLYIGSYDSSRKSYEHYLFSKTYEGFENVAGLVGLDHKGKEDGAIFADYDNDGFLDLYVYMDNGSVLYKNANKGVFENRTESAQIKGNQVNKAIFFDMDQDGDLDLFQAANIHNSVFRNNGDETFSEMANEMGLSSQVEMNTLDAAFGDFDDDGDVDLITLSQNGTILVYTNKRQGKFEQQPDSGLIPNKGARVLAVGDYNNDGFLDVFIGSQEGKQSRLYVNTKDGKFETDTNAGTMFPGIENLKVRDVEFVDFDNDGFQDIFLIGEAIKKNGNGLLLFHNNGSGEFTNVSELLPENHYTGSKLASLDYDDDGDRDIVLALTNGGVSLLRNDGGNMNHYVNMKLVGLRTGSAKNNYFGIGAKVEMRAGDLYQSLVVTDPNIYFGLGNRSKADIIRITWTNGVPQNILLPDADQALIESQTLKGSCPFLYTWNGNEYEFVKDITWRSALGMPLGIMGGTTKYAFAAASDDYIKIEADQLKAKDGSYSIQITSELWETIYMDQIELVAIDHPVEVDIFVPEQFTPPPFPGMQVMQVEKKHVPVSAKDEHGRDVLPMILEKDDQFISNLTSGRYQGITEMHDLILDPGEAGQLENLHLFLRGWIFPTDASINVALSQSGALKVKFPELQVINKRGQWQNIVTDISFPMGKDKTVIVDLSDKFLSNDHRLRIRTNMEIYWDEIFFANVENDNTVITSVLQPKKADLHYRGFSRTFRKGGRYGPHWFDYSEVNTTGKWRDLTGNYTRYGDVLPLLHESDNKYIISNAGDETSISFDASILPEIKDGWKRDFLIHSVGWVKDGDFNTAHGNTVLPLPYHEMRVYPPTEQDAYPEDPEMEMYHKSYNTRIISPEAFQNSIKPSVNE